MVVEAVKEWQEWPGEAESTRAKILGDLEAILVDSISNELMS
jgi:hypothetical protein